MEPSREKSLTIVAILSMLYGFLLKAGASFPLALLVSFIVIVLPAHWIPPRPKISFLRHVIGHELSVAVVAIALWPTPHVLRQHMPVQLAFALPLLLATLVLYFLLDIELGPEVRKVSFSKWALGCVILAIAVAGAATIVSEAR